MRATRAGSEIPTTAAAYSWNSRTKQSAIDAIWGEYIRNAETFYSGYSTKELKSILRYLQEGRLAQEANTKRVKSLSISSGKN
jgi:hypothetical protein